VDGARRLLPAHEATLLAEDYAQTVRYRVELPVSRVEDLRAALRDLTRGSVQWLEGDE